MTNALDKLYLPYDLAILAAAAQNFERDSRLRIVNVNCWEQEKQTYIADAIDFMETSGKNNTPHYDDHAEIYLDTTVHTRAISARAIAFGQAIDQWYRHSAQLCLATVAQLIKKPHPQNFLLMKQG